MKWWGYKHTNGSYQVKRFFNKSDLTDSAMSPFVERVYGPFEAEDRDEALKIIAKNI